MKIETKKELDEAILRLEAKKLSLKNDISDQYHSTLEGLKPANLLKEAFSSVTHSSAAMSGIAKTIVGVGAGFLTKRLFLGRSSTFIQKLLGNAVKFGVAKTAINNTDKIKAYGAAIYNNLFKKKTHKTYDN